MLIRAKAENNTWQNKKLSLNTGIRRYRINQATGDETLIKSFDVDIGAEEKNYGSEEGLS